MRFWIDVLKRNIVLNGDLIILGKLDKSNIPVILKLD